MKVLIYSHAPWARSGYGNITLELSQLLLKEGWEVFVVAIDHQNSPLTFGGIQTFPCMSHITNTPKELYHHAKRLQPDIILQFFDGWVLGHQWIREDGPPVVTYNPVDCSPIAHLAPTALRGAALNLAMSPHAVTEFRAANITPYKYIPHSINTDFYRPLPKDEAKRNQNTSTDAFIIGLVGTNLTWRKNIPGQLLAFKYFLDRNPEVNAYLHLHTNITKTLASSYNLFAYIQHLGLEGRVRAVNQNDYNTKNITSEDMLEIYNSFDVLLQCSCGEGFGIPILEAQACGVPVIATNFSAMPYTVGDGGLLVRETTPFPSADSNSWQVIPSPLSITYALETFYYNSELRSELCDKARKNSEAYDWNVWLPIWKRTLESVCGLRS